MLLIPTCVTSKHTFMWSKNEYIYQCKQGTHCKLALNKITAESTLHYNTCESFLRLHFSWKIVAVYPRSISLLTIYLNLIVFIPVGSSLSRLPLLYRWYQVYFMNQYWNTPAATTNLSRLNLVNATFQILSLHLNASWIP